MQRTPSLTWGDSGLEDVKSGPTGQLVNHQLQRVPRTVSFKGPAQPLFTHAGALLIFSGLKLFSAQMIGTSQSFPRGS